mgnify:CR=1 FL=1
MVELKNINGISIRILTRYEHYPAHVHVKKGNNEYKIYMNLHTEVKTGSFKKSELKPVKQFIYKHRKQITKMYIDMIEKGKTPKAIK